MEFKKISFNFQIPFLLLIACRPIIYRYLAFPEDRGGRGERGAQDGGAGHSVCDHDDDGHRSLQGGTPRLPGALAPRIQVSEQSIICFKFDSLFLQWCGSVTFWYRFSTWLTYPDADPGRPKNTGTFTSFLKEVTKTVEIKVFPTIFAWWKDPEPDLGADPWGPKT